MVYAQHQVSWAVDRLCELNGTRRVYDNDELGAIRALYATTILTHHAASCQAAMAPYGRRTAGLPEVNKIEAWDGEWPGDAT